MPPTTDDLRRKAARVYEGLLAHYGEPPARERRPPLDELIVTIISQNTADVNTARAYARLRERFPTWEQALHAGPEEVAEAIRVAGLSQIKAPRIHRILEDLAEERGELGLDFLLDRTVDEARDYLTSLHGVGPKTASCVLLFSMQRPALPVDTHVHRVSVRLGLLPPRTSAARAHGLLEELVPQALYYPFHILFIWHGRTICRAQRPDCPHCPVRDDCDYYHTVYLAEEEADARPPDGP